MSISRILTAKNRIFSSSFAVGAFQNNVLATEAVIVIYCSEQRCIDKQSQARCRTSWNILTVVIATQFLVQIYTVHIYNYILYWDVSTDCLIVSIVPIIQDKDKTTILILRTAYTFVSRVKHIRKSLGDVTSFL